MMEIISNRRCPQCDSTELEDWEEDGLVFCPECGWTGLAWLPCPAAIEAWGVDGGRPGRLCRRKASPGSECPSRRSQALLEPRSWFGGRSTRMPI